MSVFFVNVKPRSGKTEVIELDDNHFEIKVRQPPEKNKANLATIKALSDYLDIPKTKIKIVGGAKSRFKILEIQ